MRLFLLLALLAPAVDDRPNILWITCEDISPNLGCYGDAYAVTPNIEIGAGLRYWGVASRDGDVRFGPYFATYDLNNFDQQRYGILLQAKGRF